MQEQKELRTGYITLAAGYCFFVFIVKDIFRIPWWSAILAVGGVCGVFYLICLVHTVKTFILEQTADDMQLHPTTPEAFPTLNRAQLDVLTAAYMTLGFRPARDYTLESPTVTLIPSFIRLLWHQEHAVVLELSYCAPANAAPLPLRSTMLSIYGESLHLPSDNTAAEVMEPPIPAPIPAVAAPRCTSPTSFPTSLQIEHLPWAFGTSDREPTTMMQIIALPFMLGENLPVGTTPQEILRRHLSRRDEVSAALQLPVCRKMTLNLYQQWCKLQRTLILRKLQRVNLYVAIPVAFFIDKKAPFQVAKAIDAHRKAAERFPRT